MISFADSPDSASTPCEARIKDAYVGSYKKPHVKVFLQLLCKHYILLFPMQNIGTVKMCMQITHSQLQYYLMHQT